jgi:hypothetical protein
VNTHFSFKKNGLGLDLPDILELVFFFCLIVSCKCLSMLYLLQHIWTVLPSFRKEIVQAPQKQ